MDCALCHNAITAATGKLELSCSHTFHIRCLTTWFKEQSEHYLDQSCPCCRRKANEDEVTTLIDESHNTRFQDMLTTYEEQVNRWYIAANDTITKYRTELDLMEGQIIASRVLISSYEKEAHRNLIRAEAAELRYKQLEAEQVRKISAKKWAQWSAAERKVIIV